jgi:(R,R)-butanediol dehydrogenase/meso-butanediol dehydrogenase/diacetyl reductase
MKAAVLYGREDLRVEDVPDAPPPGPTEVRIRVLACGLCGTDVHEYTDAPVLSPLVERNPWSGHQGAMVIGHEFFGVVDAVGENVDAFRVGERVVAGAGVWCGECARCAEGRTNLCRHYYTFGLQRDGGMAEWVTVPARMCVSVPESCSDEDAVLAQPVAVAMHAAGRAGVTAGERVGVIGAGAIGGLLVAALASKGAEVTVFDVAQARLDSALGLGAAHGVLVGADQPDVRSTRARSFDAVFDTSGTSGGLGTAAALTRSGGRAVAVGLPASEIAFDSRSAVIGEIDILTSNAHVCSVNLPEAVELLARTSIHNLIVERRVALDDIVTAGLGPLSRREVGGKVVVRVTDPAAE